MAFLKAALRSRMVEFAAINATFDTDAEREELAEEEASEQAEEEWNNKPKMVDKEKERPSPPPSSSCGRCMTLPINTRRLTQPSSNASPAFLSSERRRRRSLDVSSWRPSDRGSSNSRLDEVPRLLPAKQRG
jgi:hypothetical protein